MEKSRHFSNIFDLISTFRWSYCRTGNLVRFPYSLANMLGTPIQAYHHKMIKVSKRFEGGEILWGTCNYARTGRSGSRQLHRIIIIRPTGQFLIWFFVLRQVAKTSLICRQYPRHIGPVRRVTCIGRRSFENWDFNPRRSDRFFTLIPGVRKKKLTGTLLLGNIKYFSGQNLFSERSSNACPSVNVYENCANFSIGLKPKNDKCVFFCTTTIFALKWWNTNSIPVRTEMYLRYHFY